MVKKISLSFLIVMLGLFLVALTSANYYLNNWKWENIQVNNDEIVSVVSQTFESNLDDAKSMIQQFAFLLPYYGPEAPFDESRMLRVLDRVHSANPAFIDVYFADINGTPFSALSKGWVEDFNVIDMQREWFLAISKKGNPSYISAPYISNTGERVISVSAPIKRNGQLVGVFGVDITLSELMPEFGVEFAITTKDGEIVMADASTSETGWVNKNIYDLRPNFRTLTEVPYLYTAGGSDEPYTVSKQSLTDSYDLFAWTNQSHEDSMNKSLMTGIIGLFICIGVLLMVTVYVSIQRQLRNLPLMVSTLEKMSLGEFTPIDVNSSNNELDQVQTSLQSLQQSISNIVEQSSIKMYDLAVQQTKIEQLIDDTNTNASSGFNNVEQVATAATELSAAASSVSDNAAHADRMAKATMQVIESSANVISETDNINQDVSSAMAESAIIVNELREHSEQINSVVEVINSISEQTNLLALNAAIEAARAGEHGRGFSVVADEVRSLAKRTQVSTVDIKNIITQLQSQSRKADEYMSSNTILVQRSQEMMLELSQAFTDIRQQVIEISEMNTMVSSASEEQSIVTQDITERIESINTTVKHSVTSAQHTQDANIVISEKTAELKEVLAFFNISQMENRHRG
ncbi:methyl-accepting chemotaxis protein [Vibrio gigantis]|uniref:methyl-accepting chemotaxis protein n=1 Tax=Vibrio gigantis TaxID=296199 RepID=UPI001EFA331A|nr:methyl-accepting chemotaxis protein [Vibrio gigantis]ULN64885.1 methyl-accepting chemotaxis protein [Vibrio gigantis]